MKKLFTLKRIGIALIVFLVVAQFIRIDKTNPPADPAQDFITLNGGKAPASASVLLKEACYDCHSHQVVYPWYTNVAPVSWWIGNHISDGVRHLNFSKWGAYSAKKANHKLEECVEMLQENEMPLSSYSFMHPKAKLTDEQRAMLISWFTALRQEMGAVTEH